MVSDEILSKEAYLIYNFTAGFAPFHNRLDHWRGNIRDKSGNPHSVELLIPQNFPDDAPRVLIDGINAQQGGFPFRLRSLDRWNSDSHAFHVLVEVSERIRNTSFEVGTQQMQLPKENETMILQEQIQMLETEISRKQSQLQELRNRSPQTASNHEIQAMLEDSITQLEAELFMIQKEFEKAEIEALEFARKYVDIATRINVLKLQKAK